MIRVKVNGKVDGIIFHGEEGTVKVSGIDIFSRSIYLVEFDDNFHSELHDCYGYCKEGFGYNVNKKNITVIK